MNLYAIYDKEDRCLFSGDQREIIGYLGMTIGMTSECFRSKLSNMKRGRDQGGFRNGNKLYIFEGGLE